MNQINSKPAIKQGWLRAILIIIPFIIFTITFLILGKVISNLIIESLINKSIADESVLSQCKKLFTQLFGFIGTLLIVWIFTKFIDRKKIVDLGFSIQNRAKDIIYGLLAGSLLIGIGFGVLWINGNLSITNINFNLFNLFQSVLIYCLVSLNEEIIVRGYILQNFMDSMNRYLALVLSSLIFTALHLLNPNVSFLGVTNIFLAGILLGIGYIFTKNLWFPLALHFSWNFFQGPIFGFEVSGTKSDTLISQTITGNEILTGGNFGFEGSLLASILCTACIVLFWFTYKKQDYKLLKA
ncbi:CPBP family intramembrane glutamic endopeptidase [Marinifilum sp. D737]|uniref:CPBP family intramembrane glutamic endopeptidase n=1 Tax=Marinifilum sp. D737 TaxID=2969628 RepID=UPI0022735B7C|nr:type II CAAX endopeptidase family protein [Marinifilum sp. D737]MCY1634501.1 CPBP family intramembrane metalloprotease [Marinifilum sp. D737]